MKAGGWLARRTFLWRDYWARRSRLRATSALICVIVAVLVGGLALAPGAWLVAARGWLATAATWTSALDPRVLAGVGIVALLAVALALATGPLATRRFRRNGIFAGQPPSAPSASARALIYLDAENQPALDFNDPHQRANAGRVQTLLIEQLRKYLDGQRADLLFYMDIKFPPYNQRRRELYRYGFRLVDVPHDPFETGGDKPGMVDMEMALQAHERSLAASTPQRIILIAADQDYIPLIYHLWREKHEIEVWGDFLPEAFRQMQAFLPVKVVEYDPQSPGANQAVAAALKADAAPDENVVEKITGWIDETIKALHAVNADTTIDPTQKMKALGLRLGKSLPWLQTANLNLTPFWLFHLHTTGALQRNNRSLSDAGAIGAAIKLMTRESLDNTRGYSVGDTSIATAQRTAQLVTRVALLARAMNEQHVVEDIRLDRLCEMVLRSPVPPPIAEVARVLSPQYGFQLDFARLFCVCARDAGQLTAGRGELLVGKHLLMTAQAPL
ncbi:MAG TPA: NYN domain-containing protein [Ktedonobacterales bacterium]|nr:NYN domain-containing protein [Ktedonobacterales bacterium]HUY79465.1 NYN domain-containing protein [Ktedonobacterales bacterium]